MSAGSRWSEDRPADRIMASQPLVLRRFAQDESRSPAPRRAAEGPILIVEDDFLVALQIEAALGDAGYTVAGNAATADEAFRFVQASRPALALMDIRLAGRMDGIDAALKLFREHGVRCIFATAHHDPETRQRAAPAQPLGWLQKPYTMPAMVTAVELALQQLEQSSG